MADHFCTEGPSGIWSGLKANWPKSVNLEPPSLVRKLILLSTYYATIVAYIVEGEGDGI